MPILCLFKIELCETVATPYSIWSCAQLKSIYRTDVCSKVTFKVSLPNEFPVVRPTLDQNVVDPNPPVGKNI